MKEKPKLIFEKKLINLLTKKGVIKLYNAKYFSKYKFIFPIEKISFKKSS